MSSKVTLAEGLVALALASGATASPEQDARWSLRTVEGPVVAVSSSPAEGGLQAIVVTLDTGIQPVEVLLAPEPVLSDIGFRVEKGDLIRARVFLSDGGPMKAHKAMNLTGGGVVRLRTLHQTPLWTASGTWQGGTCLGGRGQRHRHRGRGR